MKNISFDNPYLLLVFIPLLLAIVIPVIIAIRKENRHRSVFISLTLHILIALCATLALAGMIYTTVITETQVVVVADVSYSANRNLDTVDDYIAEIQSKLPKNAKMAVVVFGKDTKLLSDFDAEVIPSVKESGVNDSATDISGALEYASTLFGEGVIKRMILISDGKETNTDGAGKLVSAVESIYANGIYIDAVYLDNNLAEDQKEIQISDVAYAPSTYMNHEATAEVLIQSSYDTGAIAVLYVEGERVSNQAIKLGRGYNVIEIDLPTGSTGRYDYRVAITADGDHCTSNNTYDFTQTIVASLRILLVTDNEADVARARELYGDRAEIDVYLKDPNVPCTVEELCKYDEIVISDVDIRELNNYTAFIDGVEKVVSRFGKSLVTMGDLKIQNKSDDILKSLEDMLPVKYGNSDMDPKLYAIVMDTSRSMQNFSRLKIAKEAAVQLLNMLDDNDYVMVVNFWGEINVLQPAIKAVHREDVAAMIPKDSCRNTYEVPPREREHLLHQRSVKYRPETAFGEMKTAIYAVSHAHYQDGNSHQRGIGHQPVMSRAAYQKSHPEPQQAVENAYPCIGGHPFMGRDGGHLRNAHQIDHKGKKREMKHPPCSRDSLRRYGHLIVYEPESHRLGNRYHDGSKDNLDDHSC